MKRAITGIVAASLTLGTMAPAAFAATSSAPSYFGSKIAVGTYSSNVQALKVQDAGNTTAMFPFYYIQAGLQSIGYTVKWDGVAKRLDITTPVGVTLDTSNLNPGVGDAGIYINGTLVQRAPFQVANDKGGNNKPTSFMAAYYLNQALAHVGFTNTYDGTGAGWTLTAPVAKFGVQSVTALNGGQLLVKFTQAVDTASAQTTGNYVLADAAGPVLHGTPVLQADGQSVIIPLSTAVQNTTSDDISVTVANVALSTNTSTKVPTYSTVVHVADTTAPSITSVVASTNGSTAGTAVITFSEPVAANAAIKVDGSYVGATAAGTSTTITTTLDATKSHTVQVVNLTDVSGNVTPVASATFNVTVDKTLPTVTSVVASGDNALLVTFSKAVTLATVQAAVTAGGVKNETYSSLATGTVATVTAGATTSDTQFLIPITDAGLYTSTTTSHVLTLVLGAGITDTLGNATTASVIKTVAIAEDTSKPAVNSITYTTDPTSGNVTAIVLNLNKGSKVVAGGVSTAGIQVIDNTGVDKSSTFLAANSNAVAAGDKTITIPLAGSGAISGTWTFYLPAGLVVDNTFAGNQSSAETLTVNFNSAPAPASSFSVAGVSNPAGTHNVIKVDFGSGVAVKGGAVAGSATNAADYSINGSALPAGTVITLDPTYEFATITLPANSVAADDLNAIFTVNNVQTSTGAVSKPYTTTTHVYANIGPVLQSAQVFGNNILLTYNTNVTADATAQADATTAYSVTVNGVALNLGTGGTPALTAAAVAGNSKQILLTVKPGTTTVGNWSSSAAVTVTTVGAHVNDQNTLANVQQAGTTVTASH